VDKIFKFYEEHRTHAVYLRTREEIAKSVENGLFLIVENPQGQMIAGSGIYMLNDGKPFPAFMSDDQDRRAKYGVVAELGSVLRWKEGLPEDKRYPGPWHPFLISVPMVLLAQRAGTIPPGEARGELPVDYLIGDIQITERSVASRLMGQVPLTPLNWKLIAQPTKELEDHFKSTTDDKNKERPKDFYIGHPSNLVEVAKYLQKCIRFGLTTREGDVLNVDVSDLIDHWTTHWVNDRSQRVTFLDRLVANARSISSFTGKWKDFGDDINNIAPHRGRPLKVNNGYNDRREITSVDSRSHTTGAREEVTRAAGNRVASYSRRPHPLAGATEVHTRNFKSIFPTPDVL
jgi:hypothetical protein